MATPEQRTALLAGCIETALSDEVGEELKDASINIAELADTILARVYNRFDNISTELSLADAIRFGVTPVLPDWADNVMYPCGHAETFYVRINYPETE